MGKKVNVKKDAAKEQAVQVVQDPQQIQQKQPMHKFLPHSKYIVKKNKIIKKAKKQLIHYIKLDKFQIKNAVQALQQYCKKTGSGNNLFQDVQEGFIYLEIVLATVPSEYSIRPVQIPLPVPIYSQQYKSRFTVFCSEPQRQYLEQIESLDVPLMSEVIGYHNLKKNYQQTKDKLSLLSANDLFFCDWKIYNLLRKPLGKLFYQKKKIPYPIECEAKNLPEDTNYQQYLNSLLNYTYFMMGNGPVYNIKIGRIGMQVKDLVKNIIHGVYNTLPHILGKQVPMQRIRQISIKTFNSPSLPVYCNLSAKEKELWHEDKKKSITKSNKKSKSNSKMVEVC